MALLLKNARVVDPQVDLDEQVDILVRDGNIVEMGHGLDMPKGIERDLSGKVILPGLVDPHVHLRDPGLEYKEDIATGTRAAAHGGYTDICCMPNTMPVIDTGAIVEYVMAKAREVGRCRLWVAGACTKGEQGEALSEMGDMVAHGAVAFSDDGRGVQDAGVMRRVMDYASQFGKTIMSHCQDEALVGKGQINEGAVSTRLGLAGWPAAGEELQIFRDIELSRLTGCPLHIQHLTTARGLHIVREAKAQGVNVTCEVTPHHMLLCEDDIDETYNTNLKVNPPLRSVDDARAVIDAAIDGTADCIATDHAPHAAFEKAREFELAPFGMTGVETSVGLIVDKLVNTGKLSWLRMAELMAVNPRKILNLAPVRIEVGGRADLTVIDPKAKWTVTESEFESKADNSGYLGWELTGRATDVYVGGYATMEDGVLTDEPLHA